MAIDKDVTVYAKTPAEAQDRWRKRIKFDLLLLKADKTDPKKDPFEGKTPQQRLTQRYHSFAKRCTRPAATSCWRCILPR